MSKEIYNRSDFALVLKRNTVITALKEIIRRGNLLKESATFLDEVDERFDIKDGEFSDDEEILKLIDDAEETLSYLNCW